MKRREELDKYHDLSVEELQTETARLKESLFRLKFKLASEKSTQSNVSAKKEIAGAAANDYPATSVGQGDRQR